MICESFRGDEGGDPPEEEAAEFCGPEFNFAGEGDLGVECFVGDGEQEDHAEEDEGDVKGVLEGGGCFHFVLALDVILFRRWSVFVLAVGSADLALAFEVGYDSFAAGAVEAFVDFLEVVDEGSAVVYDGGVFEDPEVSPSGDGVARDAEEFGELFGGADEDSVVAHGAVGFMAVGCFRGLLRRGLCQSPS